MSADSNIAHPSGELASPGSSAQHAETFSKALHAFLQPTVNVSETIRAVVAQQQALNQEIEALNQKMGYATGIASPQQQKQLELYVQKLRLSKQRVDAIGKSLIGVKGRLWRVHTALQTRTRSLESDNALLVVQLEQKVTTKDLSAAPPQSQVNAADEPKVAQLTVSTPPSNASATIAVAVEDAEEQQQVVVAVVEEDPATTVTVDVDDTTKVHHEDPAADVAVTSNEHQEEASEVDPIPSAQETSHGDATTNDPSVEQSDPPRVPEEAVAPIEAAAAAPEEVVAPVEAAAEAAAAAPEEVVAASAESAAEQQEADAEDDKTPAKGGGAAAKGGKGKKGGGKKR